MEDGRRLREGRDGKLCGVNRMRCDDPVAGLAVLGVPGRSTLTFLPCALLTILYREASLLHTSYVQS